MSAKERLQRLRNLQTITSKLFNSICDNQDLIVNLDAVIGCELARTEKEVAAIEETIADSQKRCEALEDMVTWDGEQPDFWKIDGKTWRRCTVADVAKMVRVSNKLEDKPSELPELGLIGIWNDWFCCEGSGMQLISWKYAWIRCDSAEVTEQLWDETKGHISIQVGAFYPGQPILSVVKQSLTTEG